MFCVFVGGRKRNEKKKVVGIKNTGSRFKRCAYIFGFLKKDFLLQSVLRGMSIFLDFCKKISSSRTEAPRGYVFWSPLPLFSYLVVILQNQNERTNYDGKAGRVLVSAPVSQLNFYLCGCVRVFLICNANSALGAFLETTIIRNKLN